MTITQADPWEQFRTAMLALAKFGNTASTLMQMSQQIKELDEREARSLVEISDHDKRCAFIRANLVIEGVEGKNSEQREALLALMLGEDEAYLASQESINELRRELIEIRSMRDHLKRMFRLGLTALSVEVGETQ